MRTYTVKVQRTLYQETEIEVEAISEFGAEVDARNAARRGFVVEWVTTDFEDEIKEIKEIGSVE